MISLVYGDSYRAKVLFSSIPAPVPDLWGQGLHIMCDWICFNVITYSIQLPSPESKLHTLCSLKNWRSAGRGIRAPLGTLSSFSTKTYVVGTHKKRLSEALLMSIHSTRFSGQTKDCHKVPKITRRMWHGKITQEPLGKELSYFIVTHCYIKFSRMRVKFLENIE